MMWTTDQKRLERLLALPVLLVEERNELYRLAKKLRIDIRHERLRRLMQQGGLLDDDSAELRRLGNELGVQITLKRIDFTDY